MVVHVLSVSEEYHNREAASYGTQTFETTGFVARAEVRKVIQSDHGLAPGDIVVIHYKIRTAKPLPLGFHDAPLKPGENTTLSVLKSSDGYQRR
jgi:hypothetical protein